MNFTSVCRVAAATWGPEKEEEVRGGGWLSRPHCGHLDLTGHLTLWDLLDGGWGVGATPLPWTCADPSPGPHQVLWGAVGKACRWEYKEVGAEAWNSYSLLSAALAAVLTSNLPHVGATK